MSRLMTASWLVLLGMITVAARDVKPAARVLARQHRSTRRNCSQEATSTSSLVLQDLRTLMQTSQRSLDAYIIPMGDAHQSEYVAAHDRRIKFVSGFTGSAGLVVVTAEEAALWTDGRYLLQAQLELDCSWQIVQDVSLVSWLLKRLIAASRVGSDPRLLSYESWLKYSQHLSEGGLELVRVGGEELVGQVWQTMGGRPPQRHRNVFIHLLKFAGLHWRNKLDIVRKKMSDKKVDVIVVTALDETAWLLNLRGSDFEHTPVFYSYTIIEKTRISLYVHRHDALLQESTGIRSHLQTSPRGRCEVNTTCVNVKEYGDFFSDLRSVAVGVEKAWLSPASSYEIFSSIGRSQLERKHKAYMLPSAIELMKSVKNAVEVSGMRNAQRRDSAVLIEFIAMLEKEVKDGKFWTEISAATKLEDMRRAAKYNRGLSFATISAVGPNGAIIHYRPTPETDRQLTTTDMYLLDSGGQYLDGTTDVTRTFHFGTPTSKEKETYTRVLMGSIDLAQTLWTSGTAGRDIDAIARQPLLSIGLEYQHGTGHGIGMFLGVHEGPAKILPDYWCTYSTPIVEAMFLSDEPGYYEAGKFGVRLETVLMSKKIETKYGSVFGFEAFTLVPFEPHLIDYELLTAKQKVWLKVYNKRIEEEVGEQIMKRSGSKQALDWMLARTQWSGAERPTNQIVCLLLAVLLTSSIPLL